ncbi:MAG: ATP-binding protein [Deltaproteobacteria bacterium]|nr:ATP-binding protein [Deltaproteobacteria bacterium]
MKSLPLHVRLPSPPRPFVGREADLARLRSARDAGARVIVLTGAPGVGKTALLAEHLGRHEAVERVIFVDMGAAPTEGGARGPLLDALLAAAPDATPPPADDGARDAWLVDTAEAGAFTVVLDGLERAHAGADALVAALGRHARRSAWWITSRGLAPAPSAALVPVPLGPMATDELIELARFVATAAGLDPARADAAAARAHAPPGSCSRA